MCASMGNADLEDVLRITVVTAYVDHLHAWEQQTIDGLEYEALDDEDLDSLYEDMVRNPGRDSRYPGGDGC